MQNYALETKYVTSIKSYCFHMHSRIKISIQRHKTECNESSTKLIFISTYLLTNTRLRIVLIT